MEPSTRTPHLSATRFASDHSAFASLFRRPAWSPPEHGPPREADAASVLHDGRAPEPNDLRMIAASHRLEFTALTVGGGRHTLPACRPILAPEVGDGCRG